MLFYINSCDCDIIFFANVINNYLSVHAKPYSEGDFPLNFKLFINCEPDILLIFNPMTAAIVHKNLDRCYFYNCNQCTILDTYIILKSKISQIKVVKKKITALQIYIYISVSIFFHIIFIQQTDCERYIIYNGDIIFWLPYFELLISEKS